MKLYTGDAGQTLMRPRAYAAIVPASDIAPVDGPNRAPNRYEGKADFALITARLDANEARLVRRLQPIFRQAHDRLLSRVARGAGLLALSRDLEKVLGLRAMTGVLRDELTRAMDDGRRILRREIGLSMKFADPNFTPTGAISYLNAKSLWITDVLDNRLVGQARSVLLDSLRKGDSIAQTSQKLSDLFDDYTGDDTILRDGAPLSPWRLETIARTNMTDAFNQGRIVEARQDEAQGLIDGMEYSAVIDSRTTEVCRFLDGHVMLMDDPNLDRVKPPRHYNCRSILVPIPVGVQIDEADLLTDADAAKAAELSGAGF